jgi:hypothetical protein
MLQLRTKRSTGSKLRGSTAFFTVALAAAVTFAPMTLPEPAVSTAQAQGISISVQFRNALEPHGRWVKHSRWGEVWIPARRDRDWRPYTAGRWIYTDEWGWYWVSDEDFGWVTYHYGRWVPDREFGWIWIPGNEWGPAWVQWRRGDRHAGWAPLPPQDVIYDYDDDPEFWIFVSFNNFTAPNIRRVIVPRQERVIYIRQTVIVNRTIIVDSGRRIAVNPGIEPRIVAARIGRPIRIADVKPVVVAGTVGVRGAVEIQADRSVKQRDRVRVQITERKETIAPAKEVPPPQALKKGEEGRFGERPPEAAKEQAQQSQPSAAKGAPDAAKGKGDDAAKSKMDDAAKTKTDDSAKAKADDGKGKGPDLTKSKADDAAKAKADDAKGKGPDLTKSKSKADDAAKTKAKDAGDKGKQDAQPKAEPKQAPEPKQQSAPKSAPEPKQVAPKAEPKQAPEPKQQSAPKSAPEPKQAAPKAEPKQQPEPKQAAPKAEPKAAPKSAPSDSGKGGDGQKGKEKE